MWRARAFGVFTQFHCPPLLNLRTSDPLLDRLGYGLERWPIGHMLPYPLADGWKLPTVQVCKANAYGISIDSPSSQEWTQQN